MTAPISQWKEEAGQGIASRGSFRAPEIFAILLLLASVAVNYDLVLKARFSIGQTPVGLFDFLFLGLAAGVLWREFFSGPRGVRLTPGIGKLWVAALLATMVGFIIGWQAGFPPYNVVQDLRVVLYFLVAFWACSRILHPVYHLRAVPMVLLVAGFAVALQVLVVFTGELARLGIVAAARDVYIPAQVLPLAFLFLTAGLAKGRALSSRPVVVAAAILFTAAVVLSLTRVVWLGFAISIALAFFWDPTRRWRGGRQLVPALAVVLAVVLVFSGWTASGQIVEELQTRLMIFGEQDGSQEFVTIFSRLDEILNSLEEIQKRPVLGSGLGIAITHYDPVTSEIKEATFLHNSAIYYTLKLGVVGLAIYFALWVLCLRAAWSVPKGSRFYLQARLLLAGTIGFMVAGNFSGNLNSPPFMIFLATLLAGCVVLKRLSQAEESAAVHGAAA